MTKTTVDSLIGLPMEMTEDSVSWREFTAARSEAVSLLREEVSNLRGNIAKITGASAAGSVMLAVIISLLIRLAAGA